MVRGLKNKLTFVIVGRSGSGKGTQARFLLRYLKKQGVRHLETGRFLRSHLKRKNATTLLAQKIIKDGKLMPSWFPIFTWLQKLIEEGWADKHLVFDGAPRRVWEADLIDRVIEWHERPLPICIYVDIKTKEAMRRLIERGRGDDTRRAIRHRLEFFQAEVLPVVEYYTRHKRIVRVDGSRSPEEIFQEITKKLKKKLGKRWV